MNRIGHSMCTIWERPFHVYHFGNGCSMCTFRSGIQFPVFPEGNFGTTGPERRGAGRRSGLQPYPPLAATRSFSIVAPSREPTAPRGNSPPPPPWAAQPQLSSWCCLHQHVDCVFPVCVPMPTFGTAGMGTAYSIQICGWQTPLRPLGRSRECNSS